MASFSKAIWIQLLSKKYHCSRPSVGPGFRDIPYQPLLYAMAGVHATVDTLAAVNAFVCAHGFVKSINISFAPCRDVRHSTDFRTSRVRNTLRSLVVFLNICYLQKKDAK